MSKDITTSGPSRRSIAKGAAWAVPAVSVAAAAPALAASPTLCAPGESTLTVSVVNCRVLGLLSAPYFTITNNGECTVPAGTAITLTGSGLVSAVVQGLDDINVAVLYDGTSSTGTLEQPLESGATIQVNVFSGLDVTVLGDYTLTIDGASAGFDLTAGVFPVATVCDLL